MVITNKVGGQQITREAEFRGLSTDVKPIKDVPNGSVFYEMDTTNVFMYDENANTWIIQGGTSGGTGGTTDLSNYYTKTEVINLINSKEKYVLPQATSALLGGITADEKTSLETAPVKIDSTIGRLYSADGLEEKQDKPVNNTIVYGLNSGNYQGTDTYNIAIGGSVLENTTGNRNTGIGFVALNKNTTGNENVAVGIGALYGNETGRKNIAIGNSSLTLNKQGNYNTVIGNEAMNMTLDGQEITNFDNCIVIGNMATVNGNNQVQLGNSSTTTYCYGSVQDRSDERDKANIRPTTLGLDFINKLNPVEFNWNYRDDYITYERQEDGTLKLIKLPNDGSKIRSRFHQGFIAQEVKSVTDELNTDFGGYQDHSVDGGSDVLTLGYTEFIAPMVKAIQEQQTIIEQLENRIKALETK